MKTKKTHVNEAAKKIISEEIQNNMIRVKIKRKMIWR